MVGKIPQQNNRGRTEYSGAVASKQVSCLPIWCWKTEKESKYIKIKISGCSFATPVGMKNALNHISGVLAAP